MTECNQGHLIIYTQPAISVHRPHQIHCAFSSELPTHDKQLQSRRFRRYVNISILSRKLPYKRRSFTWAFATHRQQTMLCSATLRGNLTRSTDVSHACIINVHDTKYSIHGAKTRAKEYTQHITTIWRSKAGVCR